MKVQEQVVEFDSATIKLSYDEGVQLGVELTLIGGEKKTHFFLLSPVTELDPEEDTSDGK